VVIGEKMAKTVKCAIGFTQSLGNYEFIRVDIEYGDELRPDETHGEALDRLYAEVEEKVVEKAGEIYSSLGRDAKSKTKIVP
jgi:hypothetical protein